MSEINIATLVAVLRARDELLPLIRQTAAAVRPVIADLNSQMKSIEGAIAPAAAGADRLNQTLGRGHLKTAATDARVLASEMASVARVEKQVADGAEDLNRGLLRLGTLRKLGFSEAAIDGDRLAASARALTEQAHGYAGAAQQAATASGSWGDQAISVRNAVRGFLAFEGVRFLKDFTAETIESAQALVKHHATTKVSIEWLQRFQRAGGDAGNDLKQIVTSIASMQDRVASFNTDASNALRRLGIDVEWFRGLAPEQQFVALSNAVRSVRDPAEQLRLSIDVLGETGDDVLPTLKRGFDDVAGAAVGMSTEAVLALDDLGRRLTHWKQALKDFGGEMLAGLYQTLQTPVLSEGAPEAYTQALAREAARKSAAALEKALPSPLRDPTLGIRLPTIDADAAVAAFDRQFGTPDVQRDRAKRAAEAAKEAARQVKAVQVAQEDLRRSLIPLTAAEQQAVRTAMAHSQSLETVAKAYDINLDAARAYASFLKDVERVEFDSVGNGRFDSIGRVVDVKAQVDNALQLRRQHEDEIARLSLNTYDQERRNVQLWLADQQQAMRQRGDIWVGEWNNLAQVAKDKLDEIARAEAIALEPLVNPGAMDRITGYMNAIPGMLTQALTGGGGFSGFGQGMLAMIGGDLGQLAGNGRLRGMLTNAVTGKFGIDSGAGTNMVGDLMGGLLSGGMSALFSIGIPKLFNGIKRLFTGAPEWEKLGKSIGRDFGVQIPQEMLKAWEAESKKIGQRATSLLHLDEIITQAGGVMALGFDKATTSARELFSLIDDGKVSIKQVGEIFETFDNVFAQLAQEVGPTSLITSGMRELIRLNDEYGANSQAVNQFVTANLQKATSGLGAFLRTGAAAYTALADAEERLKDASGEETERIVDEIRRQQQIIEATAITTESAASAMAAAIVGTFAEFQKRGMSVSDALAAVMPLVNDLQLQLEKAGLSGGEAFDHLRTLAGLAADEVAGPALSAVGALNQAFVGLHNSGLLTSAMFGGLAGQVAATHASLVAMGYDGNAVMLLMQPTLQTIWELQKDFNFAVDEGTQALIDQAVEAGIVGDKHRDAMERAALAMEHVDQVITALAQHMGVDLPDAARRAADGMNSEFSRVLPPAIAARLPQQQDEPIINMARGGSGRVYASTLFRVGEAGPEDYRFSGANRSFSDGDSAGQQTITIAPKFEIHVHGDADLAKTTEEKLIPLLHDAWERIGTLRTEAQEILGVQG